MLLDNGTAANPALLTKVSVVMSDDSPDGEVVRIL